MGKNKAVKPTLAQKKLMSEAGFIINNWLVMSETDEELRLVSQNSGRFRSIKKSPVQGSRRGLTKTTT